MNTKKTKQPFFIVGCPRSGTTLLQILLDSHPDITIPPESQIFIRFSPIFKFYGDLGKPENIKRFVSDLVKDFAIRDWNLDISIGKYVAQSKGNGIKDIISYIFEEYSRKEKKLDGGTKRRNMLFFNRN